MTIKLPLTITQRGLSELIDAGDGTTNSVRVASIGLTATPFVVAPTITNLPGEHTRLDTVSGNAVSEDVLHMVATDSSDATYTVTGVGLYLDSGVLFGVYSLEVGDDALFQKASAATFLFAADITFEAGQAALIDFGDTTFLYPPATETTKGVAYLATAAEVAAGIDAEKIVTPVQLSGNFIAKTARAAPNGVASLGADGRIPSAQLPPVDSIDTFYATSDAQMTALASAGPGDFCQRTDLSKTYRLAASPPSTLANWVEFLSPGSPVRTVNSKIGDVVLAAADVDAPPTARKVSVAGLAKGGGDFTADRTITVDIATAAETLAGLINDKAVTPASLATLLASLTDKAAASVRIDGAGLATGGGDLSANRVLTVPKATGADVDALTDDTRAVTAKALSGTLRNIGANGYLRIPGTPLILQWGSGTFITSDAGPPFSMVQQFKSFPFAFPNACFQVLFSVCGNADGGDQQDETPWIGSWQKTGFNMQNHGDWLTFPYAYLAIGN